MMSHRRRGSAIWFLPHGQRCAAASAFYRPTVRLLQRPLPDGALGIVAQRKIARRREGDQALCASALLTYLSVRSVTGDYLDVLRVIAQRYLYPYFI